MTITEAKQSSGLSFLHLLFRFDRQAGQVPGDVAVSNLRSKNV
jgi:hypothetical protein